MKDFKEKKITVMGLGLHGGGVGTAKFFCNMGADVLVTDLKKEEELKESLEKLEGLDISFVLGEHREEDFINADLIIRNPDVPWDSFFIKKAKERGIPIKTDIEIFFDLFKGKIIGITGTKGKSTVATLVYLFLKKRYSVVLGGNIGVSPLELLLKNKEAKIAVLELSSFELEGLKRSPETAVFTNMLKDHLKRHGSFDKYVEAKKEIFLNQKEKNNLILNYDDKKVRSFAKEAVSEVYFFSTKNIIKGSFLKEGKIYFKKEEVCSLENIKLKGNHNLSNVLASVAAAKIYSVSSKDIRKVLMDFEGVPFRQQFITEVNGKNYYNDTTATIPDAVIEALKSFSGDIVLIAGGVDKGSEYKDLAKKIKDKVSSLVLLPGTASDKLKKELERIGFENIFLAENMKEAVKKSSSLKGNIVLLSPGGSSFNLFKNEFDRGKKFNKEVENLKNEK